MSTENIDFYKSNRNRLHYVTIRHGVHPHDIEALITISGNDVIVIIGGGTLYHIGSVAVAWSHKSLKNPRLITSSASVINISGHKEDDIVKEAALKISKTLKTNVTVIAGIHIDNATQDDINNLITCYRQLIDKICIYILNLQGL